MVPFIPIEGVTLEECVKLAERVGAEIWNKLRVPVYLYEAAARRPERVNLENIRRGQFEALVQGDGHGARARARHAATRSAIPPPAPSWWARANS